MSLCVSIYGRRMHSFERLLAGGIMNCYKYLGLHAAVSEETCKIWSERALCRKITAFSCRLLGINANTGVSVRYQISLRNLQHEREFLRGGN